ncbi:MAG: KpsF/GutQ family sugar-phosphate isomerase [Robiginitomaculum sp.]|nr:MAG: KpsF/GutQ family sugar-phosphate isomerase [Robiginitomaculum sp.]
MDEKNDLNTAQTVIKAEADALHQLAGAVDGPTFSNAVQTLIQTKGHCIVLGVGKSGHIGRKIAATLASTGTPSFFVHPAEASHGDLGMVTTGSTVLAISNSGESRELVDVLHYCTKRDIPIIAITCRPGSTLGKAANIVLALPAVPEACPNGLVPTTSMAMTLAMGDALAIAVMQRRGFTVSDFGDRHPGGKLGLQLQRVSDWMQTHSAPPPILGLDTPAKDVLGTITKGRMGCAAVLDKNGRLAGIITDGDLRRAIAPDFFVKTAAHLMTVAPYTVTRQDRVSDVIAQLTQRRIANVFVVDNNKPVAAMHLKDLLEDGYL